ARELDLVRAHEACAVDVDELPVEQVLLQEDLLRAALERLEIEARRPQPDAAVLDLLDRVGGHEHLATRDGREQSGHRRVLVLAEPHDEVVHPAELRAGGDEQAAAHDETEMEDARCPGSGCHPPTLPLADYGCVAARPRRMRAAIAAGRSVASDARCAAERRARKAMPSSFGSQLRASKSAKSSRTIM